MLIHKILNLKHKHYSTTTLPRKNPQSAQIPPPPHPALHSDIPAAMLRKIRSRDEPASRKAPATGFPRGWATKGSALAAALITGPRSADRRARAREGGGRDRRDPCPLAQAAAHASPGRSAALVQMLAGNLFAARGAREVSRAAGKEARPAVWQRRRAGGSAAPAVPSRSFADRASVVGFLVAG